MDELDKKDRSIDTCVVFLRSLGKQIRGMLLSEGSLRTRLQEVLGQFSDVFHTNVGCCGISVGIRLWPDAELKAFPCHCPTIHQQEKIEAELKRNVEHGILKPVSSAVCAFLQRECHQGLRSNLWTLNH